MRTAKAKLNVEIEIVLSNGDGLTIGDFIARANGHTWSIKFDEVEESLTLGVRGKELVEMARILRSANAKKAP